MPVRSAVRNKTRSSRRTPLSGASSLSLSKTGLVFYAKNIGGVLTDVVGESIITIVSGTTWADWVVTLEATAALLAADTGHIFFTSAGVPREVRLSTLFFNNLDYAFASDGILLIYSSPQSAANIAKIDQYIKTLPTAYGGYFECAATAAATASFRIDTVGAVPWILDGAYVPSGQFTSVNKDTTRSISLGVSDPNIVSLYFYNADYSAYGTAYPLSMLSAIRPTDYLLLYNNAYMSGSLLDLASMRPANLFLAYLSNVSGDIADLSSMRPNGALSIVGMPLVTECSEQSEFWHGSTTINIAGCGINQLGIDNILASVFAGGKINGSLNLSGGTNAAPSAAGEDNIALLLMAGWSVTTN